MSAALNADVPEGYKRTEVGVIPGDWKCTRIGDLFEISAGGDFDPRQSSNLCDENHPYPIYSNSIFNFGLYGFCSYGEHPADAISVTARGTLGSANFRDHVFTAIGRVLVLEPKQKMAGSFFSEFLNHQVKFVSESTGVPQLTAPQISNYKVANPPIQEQYAIATALSDVDALLAKLDQLIAKKRDLKQAAMQQLLTGQTRLPGFSGKWVERVLGDIAPLQRGFDLPNSQLKRGPYPVVYSNGIGNLHAAFQVKGPGVVTGRSGTIGAVTYVEKDFWPHNTSLWVKAFKDNDAKFVFYLYTRIGLERFATGSGVPTLNRNDVHMFKIRIPASKAEQTAIATILSDMDTELTALEARQGKTRALKQGMMQALLTGRIRLPITPGNSTGADHAKENHAE